MKVYVTELCITYSCDVAMNEKWHDTKQQTGKVVEKRGCCIIFIFIWLD